MRPLLGVAPPIQVVTGPLAVLFAVLTQLGDLWFLFALVALVYWLDAAAPRVGRGLDRGRSALVVALLVGAVAVLETLKPLFGVPRPAGFDAAPVAAFLPEILRPLYAWMATASGYGFPSGHAVASTIVWGGLAWAVRVGRRRARVAVAAGLAALVSASRVLLGVHRPVDVVVGAVVGLAYLAVVLGLLRDAGRALALATGVSLVAAATTGLTTEVAAVVGLALGLTATWYRLGTAVVAAPATRAGSLATLALGVAITAPALGVAIAVSPLPVTPSVAAPTWAVAIAAAVGGGLLLALPLVGERVGPAVAGRRENSVERT